MTQENPTQNPIPTEIPTNEVNEVNEIEIIPGECYIQEKSSLYNRITKFLEGLLPVSDTLGRRSVYNNFSKEVVILQNWDDESFLVKNFVENRFLIPNEVSVFIRETNNCQLQTSRPTNQPADSKTHSLNFVTDLKCDPSKLPKELKFSNAKRVELANLERQQIAPLMDSMTPEQWLEEVIKSQVRMDYAKELIAKHNIKVQNEAKLKQNLDYAQERENKAQGIKKTKSGKIIKTSQTNKAAEEKAIQMFGAQKVKYWKALKTVDLNNIEDLKVRAIAFDAIFG